jgi:D-alanine--D-alanine ligase
MIPARIAVIYDPNPSDEHLKVSQALRERGHDVLDVRWRKGDPLPAVDFYLLMTMSDIKLFSLHKAVKATGIPFSGSDMSVLAICTDKLAAKEKLKQNGLAVLPHVLINQDDPDPVQKAIAFGFPSIIKPRRGCYGHAVTVCRSEADIMRALPPAFAFDYQGDVLCERFASGREFTVGVLNDVSYCPIEVLAGDDIYTYEKKQDALDYLYVGDVITGAIGERLRRLALDAHNTLGCAGHSRADMRLDESGKIYILEINGMPGLRPLSLMTISIVKCSNPMGFEYGEMLEEIVGYGSSLGGRP